MPKTTKETQDFFTLVDQADRASVTRLHRTALQLADELETFARQLKRHLQLMERTETEPAIRGRVGELQQTIGAMIRESDALEAAAGAVSRVEEQLHRIVNELLPAAKEAGYKVKVPK